MIHPKCRTCKHLGVQDKFDVEFFECNKIIIQPNAVDVNLVSALIDDTCEYNGVLKVKKDHYCSMHSQLSNENLSER